VRITVLTTQTVNTRVFYEPLPALGYEMTVIEYDHPGVAQTLPQQVINSSPDWVLYIGAIPICHANVPPTEILAQIGHSHKTVLFCCDGAEPLWWPYLIEYYDRKIFALQVNIDGVRAGPIGEHGMTALCPVAWEPATYVPSWGVRPINIGFGGGQHGSRRATMLQNLINAGLLIYRPRVETSTEEYRNFLMSCWCIWNSPETGGMTSKHVKARILEAALAGCVVLEEKDSPAADWFDEGRDYLTYETVKDVGDQLNFFRSYPVEARLIAERLAIKVRRYHSPKVFWRRVEAAIGLAEPLEMEFPKPMLSKARPANSNFPRLIISHNNFNLVDYMGEFFVVPHQVGTVYLDRVADRARPGIRKFTSECEARTAIGA
jgi:hypothetical protein